MAATTYTQHDDPAQDDLLPDDQARNPSPVSADHHEPDERKRLLGAVAAVGDVLLANADYAEQHRRLSDQVVHDLQSHDLWRLRLCQELGGLEQPIVTQIDILSTLAEHDASTAWCTMVSNNAVSILGATMPDSAVERIFASGVPACSIVAAPGGKVTAVPGGFQVSGTWRLASGIHHAEWVHATALIDGDPSRLLPLALPVADLELLDTWHPVGLAGTGSCDFSVTDYFIPAELTGRSSNPFGQIRGTRRYDLLELDYLESYEHLAFALGVARHALDALQGLLVDGTAGRHAADREVVQSEVGRAEVTLRALKALALDIYRRVDAAAVGEPAAWSPSDRQLPRALAVRATEHALACTQLAFHRAGAVALHKPNVFDQMLRDMSVAATHFMVDDSALSSYAFHLLEHAEEVIEWRRHAD